MVELTTLNRKLVCNASILDARHEILLLWRAPLTLPWTLGSGHPFDIFLAEAHFRSRQSSEELQRNCRIPNRRDPGPAQGGEGGEGGEGGAFVVMCRLNTTRAERGEEGLWRDLGCTRGTCGRATADDGLRPDPTVLSSNKIHNIIVRTRMREGVIREGRCTRISIASGRPIDPVRQLLMLPAQRSARTRSRFSAEVAIRCWQFPPLLFLLPVAKASAGFMRCSDITCRRDRSTIGVKEILNLPQMLQLPKLVADFAAVQRRRNFLARANLAYASRRSREWPPQEAFGDHGVNRVRLQPGSQSFSQALSLAWKLRVE